MRVLDLFSGIGGFSLGLERAGMEIVAFCEIEPYCQKVLAKHWPDVPIYSDIRTLTAERLKDDGISDIGLVCGGFPCQPYSQAGKQRGAEDDRDLWPELLRIVREIQPNFIIGENVVGIIGMALDQVLSDLEALGYSAGAFVVPACAVNAPHTRKRVWIIAHTKRDKSGRQEPHDRQAGRMGGEFQPVSWDRDWESALREFRGMDDGLSYGVDRIDTLRNAVTPQVVEIIGMAIMDRQR